MAERIYGTHHIGITVPDIEQGIAFFEAVFGAVTVFRTGPFKALSEQISMRDFWRRIAVGACAIHQQKQ